MVLIVAANFQMLVLQQCNFHWICLQQILEGWFASRSSRALGFRAGVTRIRRAKHLRCKLVSDLLEGLPNCAFSAHLLFWQTNSTTLMQSLPNTLSLLNSSKCLACSTNCQLFASKLSASCNCGLHLLLRRSKSPFTKSLLILSTTLLDVSCAASIATLKHGNKLPGTLKSKWVTNLMYSSPSNALSPNVLLKAAKKACPCPLAHRHMAGKSPCQEPTWTWAKQPWWLQSHHVEATLQTNKNVFFTTAAHRLCSMPGMVDCATHVTFEAQQHRKHCRTYLYTLPLAACAFTNAL